MKTSSYAMISLVIFQLISLKASQGAVNHLCQVQCIGVKCFSPKIEIYDVKIYLGAELKDSFAICKLYPKRVFAIIKSFPQGNSSKDVLVELYQYDPINNTVHEVSYDCKNSRLYNDCFSLKPGQLYWGYDSYKTKYQITGPN